MLRAANRVATCDCPKTACDPMTTLFNRRTTLTFTEYTLMKYRQDLWTYFNIASCPMYTVEGQLCENKHDF